jgi:glutamyl-tRNA synthetase
LRGADDARLTAEVVARLPGQCKVAADEVAATRILALMPGLKERAKTLVELTSSAAFLARAVPLEMEPKAAALLTADAVAMLGRLAPALAATDFSVAGVDAALRAFAEAEGRKLGAVAQPLRAALTGSTMSPGIDATLAALGRDESLARIAAAADG